MASRPIFGRCGAFPVSRHIGMLARLGWDRLCEVALPEVAINVLGFGKCQHLR